MTDKRMGKEQLAMTQESAVNGPEAWGGGDSAL